ncbi:glycerophosphodiester phosphodiesterase [Acinetobacter sp. MD2(2019)]|uniref:glycerophosphodiester phosphodiesterase n=1 Tax=Acinetobacter sp. MD2(2019) TaxID=2605273 RepID=UPI002D1F188C|nr:glycerophosphodiester phosphodiesterase family protein [Acinetobacter sp. MD2(2019)]MEB3754688.1 glycerophosphodiester phosphodiesterase [Acinetobacter sp. MD2(2019)]
MQIIGHRGARGEAPENTLGGFQYLANLGIHAVEFDVRQLKDLSLIVMHDDNFKRTTGLNKPVAQYSTTEHNKFDHRIEWPSWPTPELTPTLPEVLTRIQHFKHIEVEVKAVANQAAAEQIVPLLINALAGFETQATITSFDTKILTVLQQHQTHFKRGLLLEKHPERGIETALKLGCDRIGWSNKLATKQRIAQTHQAALKSSVWTVNQVDRAKQLRDWGVQGLITDHPKIMLHELQQ